MSINSIFARITNPNSKAYSYPKEISIQDVELQAEKKGLIIYRCGTARQWAVATDEKCVGMRTKLGERISLEKAEQLIKKWKK